jgi:hypothetical protein
MKWNYLNVQYKTVPSFGIWSKLSENDLNKLSGLQQEGWEIYQALNIRGSFGFSSHILFMLRKENP